MSQTIMPSLTRYYILHRQLYRIRAEDTIPTAWNKGSWEKRPFAFALEITGHRVTEEEANAWIQNRLRRKSLRSRH